MPPFIDCAITHSLKQGLSSFLLNSLPILSLWWLLSAEHRLDDEISGGSLSDTSFARAMALSMGTVSVLDALGVSWSRIWCGESLDCTHVTVSLRVCVSPMM